jgi:hypothetical protein
MTIPISIFSYAGVVAGCWGHIAGRGGRSNAHLPAIAFLADTIPSSPEEFRVIGYVAGSIIIGALLVASVYFLFPRRVEGKEDQQRKTQRLQSDRRHCATVVELAKLEKELRDYVHEMNHGIRKELQSMVSAGEDREERQEERLTLKLGVQDKKWDDSIRRVHDKIEAAQQITRNEIDQKLGAVHTEIRTIPETVVNLLQKTGAIGRRDS